MIQVADFGDFTSAGFLALSLRADEDSDQGYGRLNLQPVCSTNFGQSDPSKLLFNTK